MLVDSHCHLNLIDYDALGNSLTGVIEAAKKVGVAHFLCVGTELTDLPAILKITAQYPEVSASVGLHPNEEVTTEPTVTELIHYAAASSVVAIGETGLDYYRTTETQCQQERFRRHIQAAIACQKPLIIHTREARADTLRILREEKGDKVGGVLHCFTEDWETAEQALELGFYISFSGIVTFKNALSLQTVAKKVPLDRMLIETDAPFLAPVPYRGKINQPAYVKEVAEFLAVLKGVSFERIATATTKNFYDLFK
jgi:TatD DNase family protein